jgi:hypothetical protein
MISQTTLKNKARYLKQGLTLTGLGTDTFSKAMENAARLYANFSRYVGENDLQPIGFVEADRTGATMTVSNRYFTSRNEDPYGKNLPIGASIDPSGILASCVGPDLFHGEDNSVQYFQKKKTSNDERFK